LVGCGHVSDLLMRQVWPLALMLCADRVPIESAHFGGALTQAAHLNHAVAASQDGINTSFR
jgi:hypothetical protein